MVIRLQIVLPLLTTLFNSPASAAQHPVQKPVRPMVLAAWEQAGAEFGWFSVDAQGFCRFDTENAQLEACQLSGSACSQPEN